METITKKEAIARNFVIWSGDDEGIFYARSQNRADQDYGRVYLINN